jgi:hypothetical protein
MRSRATSKIRRSGFSTPTSNDRTSASTSSSKPSSSTIGLVRWSQLLMIAVGTPRRRSSRSTGSASSNRRTPPAMSVPSSTRVSSRTCSSLGRGAGSAKHGRQICMGPCAPAELFETTRPNFVST